MVVCFLIVYNGFVFYVRCLLVDLNGLCCDVAYFSLSLQSSWNCGDSGKGTVCAFSALFVLVL